MPENHADEEDVSVQHRDQVITGPRWVVEKVIASIEKQEARRARWPKDLRAAMTALCKKFPTLADADGIDPWDVHRFMAWLNGPAPGSGASLAGRFVLTVWNRDTDWTECGLGPPGRFNVVHAIGVWDDEHRAAFSEWVEAPFFP